MEQSLESSLETINLSGQQQPTSMPNTPTGDDIDQMLSDLIMYPHNPSDLLVALDPNNNNDQFDINALIDPSNDQINSMTLIETQSSGTSFDSDALIEFLESLQKQEPVEIEQQRQSSFIENYDQTNSHQSLPGYSPSVSFPTGSSSVEPKAIDNLIYAQAYVDEQDRRIKAALKTKKIKTQQHRSTTVAPVEYILHSGGCEPCTTVQIQNDFAYQQQLLEYDMADSKKIQIISQPRSKFRPRTQNESKTSSHYLRCEDGVKPEYPTINIPQTWFFQSDVNLIEVALMGIDKQPHPYSIDNKNSSNTYEDHALIFKQNDPNVLYFRLTNEDFQNGYKTFMIEFIKSKQDDVITKELIRTRQLEHSMLRFTRIFQVGKGNFQRDDGSEEYSSVMIEAYGDVDIEHIGPRYGPMSGQEMLYIVLKGRILKSDLKIDIVEQSTGWHYSVENFTKNGNVVYFLMPSFPYPQYVTMKANIIIYYKGEELSQTTYLYKGSLDQELAELHLNDPCTTTASSAVSNSFNASNFFCATGVCPTRSSQKTSTIKRPKRLNIK